MAQTADTISSKTHSALCLCCVSRSPPFYPLLGWLGWLWWGHRKCEDGFHRRGRPQCLPPSNRFGTSEESELPDWILEPLWQEAGQTPDSVTSDSLVVRPRDIILILIIINTDFTKKYFTAIYGIQCTIYSLFVRQYISVLFSQSAHWGDVGTAFHIYHTPFTTATVATATRLVQATSQCLVCASFNWNLCRETNTGVIYPAKNTVWNTLPDICQQSVLLNLCRQDYSSGR